MPVAVIALMAAVAGAPITRLSLTAPAGLATGFLAAILPESATGPLSDLPGLPAGNKQAILWSRLGLGASAGGVGHGLRRTVRP